MLWKTSSYRIFADGAANRLYDATVSIGDESSISLGIDFSNRRVQTLYITTAIEKLSF